MGPSRKAATAYVIIMFANNLVPNSATLPATTLLTRLSPHCHMHHSDSTITIVLQGGWLVSYPLFLLLVGALYHVWFSFLKHARKGILAIWKHHRDLETASPPITTFVCKWMTQWPSSTVCNYGTAHWHAESASSLHNIQTHELGAFNSDYLCDVVVVVWGFLWIVVIYSPLFLWIWVITSAAKPHIPEHLP